MRLFLLTGTMLFYPQARLAEKPIQERHAVFTSEDEIAVHTYYGRRPFRLPPGIEKKIARTGKLPAGWRRKIGPLPLELERRLSRLQCGDCERGVIEGCAVIYSPRTAAVFSVISIFGP